MPQPDYLTLYWKVRGCLRNGCVLVQIFKTNGEYRAVVTK